MDLKAKRDELLKKTAEAKQITPAFIEMEPKSGIREIELDKMIDFEGHPFKVLDDDAMEELMASIRENGIITPGLVRHKGHGIYEIIQGHRRKHACERLGLATMPVEIRSLSDDEAAILMVDSNLYRPQIFPSEKAKALQIKLEAMRHQGQAGGRSDEALAKEVGMSASTLQRYIRLTKLSDDLLHYVDQGIIPFRPAVHLADLKEETQEVIETRIADGLNSEIVEYKPVKLTTDKALELYRVDKHSGDRALTMAEVEAILFPNKKVEIDKWDFKEKDTDGFFPDHSTGKQKKEWIMKALAFYAEHHDGKWD